MQAPRVKHLDAVFRVMRYLKCTSGLGLYFPSETDLQLKGYCDSDWGVVPLPVDLLLVIVCSWETLLYLGKPRNSL